MKGAAGFTLIEILVAAALSLVVLALVFESMMSAQKITTLTRTQAGGLDALQSIAGTVGDDVRRANFIQPNLAGPAWLDVASSSVIQSLNLQVPPGRECAATYDVSYYLVPRSALTGDTVSEWVQLPVDARNTTQNALLRSRRCNGVVLTRVVADYLTDTTISIAQVGSSTYTDAPTSGTGGNPYLSVALRMARTYTTRDSTVREPRTGTLRYVSASRTVEIPTGP